MKQPPEWNENELERQRQGSIALFRVSRLQEPLEGYATAFDEYRAEVETLIEQTVDLSQLRQQAGRLLKNKKTLELVRYLAGPLISADDLKTLLGVKSISAKQINADPEFAAKVIDLVVDTLDQRRFPWVRDGREPEEAERLAAVIASATLLANRKVATTRRNEGKELQESAVVAMLDSIGWKRVPPKNFDLVEDGPKPREYCRETTIHGNKADVVIRLLDRRLLLIECKVSNSSVNSIKRLNDAKKKANEWRRDLGEMTVTPAAVLSGVFDLRHLKMAQARGLTLFWGHDLKQLANWIKSAKPDNPTSRK